MLLRSVRLTPSERRGDSQLASFLRPDDRRPLVQPPPYTLACPTFDGPSRQAPLQRSAVLRSDDDAARNTEARAQPKRHITLCCVCLTGRRIRKQPRQC